MKELVYFIIGAFTFVMTIVIFIFEIISFSNGKKLMENTEIRYKVKDKRESMNLIYALVLLLCAIPFLSIYCVSLFKEKEGFNLWGDMLYMSSMIVLCIFSAYRSFETMTAYITDKGLLTVEKLIAKDDLKYVLIMPDMIKFYHKDISEPIKLQMSENKSEIIEFVKNNYNKEN